MAIKFGKGIGGFLGRSPEMQYEYVPLPYKEMLTGNLMKQQAYDKNLEITDKIDALYNQPVLAQDEQALQDKEISFNAELDKQLKNVGGDLGKLSGFLSSQFRRTANDKDYLNMLTQKKAAADYFESIDKLDIDPQLKDYYKQTSLANYKGANQGGFQGVTPTTLNSLKFSAELDRIVNAVPLTDKTYTQTLYNVQGNMFAAYEDLVEKGYSDAEISQMPTKQRTIKDKGRNKTSVYNSIMGEINTSPYMQKYLADVASASGLDPVEYIQNRILAESDRHGIQRSVGKLTDLYDPETEEEGSTPLNPGQFDRNVGVIAPPSYIGEARTAPNYQTAITHLQNPDIDPDLKGLFQKEYEEAAIAAYGSVDASFTDGIEQSNINKGAEASLVPITHISKTGNLSFIADKAAVQEARNLISTGDNTYILPNPGIMSQASPGAQAVLSKVLENAKRFEKESQEEFKKVLQNKQTRPANVNMYTVEKKLGNETAEHISTLLRDPNSGVEFYTPTTEGNMVRGTLTEGSGGLSRLALEGAKITGVSSRPVPSEQGPIRILTVSGTQTPSQGKGYGATYSIRMPEEDYSKLFGKGTTNYLLEGTSVSEAPKSPISHKLDVLSTADVGARVGLNTDLKRIYELPEDAFYADATKVKEGYKLMFEVPSLDVSVEKTLPSLEALEALYSRQIQKVLEMYQKN